MSTSMTLLELRTAARQRSDQENASGDYSTSFIKDSELNSYINQSAFELYDLLISAYGNDYYLADPYTVTADGTNDSFALPSDFYKLVSAAQLVSGSNYLPMKQASFAEMIALSGSTTVGVLGMNNLIYRLRADKIWFAPKPASGQVVKLYYIPRLTTLASDSSTFDGISGWTEYVIVDAAIKCMQKEESDVSVLMLQKEGLLRRIAALSENRDAGSAATVSDTSSNSVYDPFSNGWWNR